MATFKETREILLASYASNIILIEEYVLLSEENSSNNLDFPYYNYPLFNLDSQSEAECRANFRVKKALHSSGERCFFKFRNPWYATRERFAREQKAFACMIVKRYSFPCRYSDMISIFGRPVPELCMICNSVTN